MMGSDSGLSRGSGCPEKCEARAMRWQERAGCQSKKVALIRRKAKESACQACSAKPRRGGNGRKERRWGTDTGENKGRLEEEGGGEQGTSSKSCVAAREA
ncbi:hypothetical protein PBY51_015196 [Eleginops maclovinus]|uniref:Uncharacterized protein n=1 Tax=Eleginops maclovinus TaxID=56733 RepID=A0AAN8ABQ8_ELEMC|nr:hypothetical protein PBY51_015196 [Eleginops maclovinus]